MVEAASGGLLLLQDAGGLAARRARRSFLAPTPTPSPTLAPTPKSALALALALSLALALTRALTLTPTLTKAPSPPTRPPRVHSPRRSRRCLRTRPWC